MTRAVPLRNYAIVAASMFLAFATAMTLNPGVGTWLGAGLAAVAATAVAYAYLESRVEREPDVGEMFE